MKRALPFLVCALTAAVLVGCEASGRVGDNDDTHKTEYKKTTVRDNDSGTSKTEVKTEKTY
jgi:hypothetical protein